MPIRPAATAAAAATALAFAMPAATAIISPATLAAQERPLTFMDVQELKRAGSWTPGPDGEWMLYAVTTPNWEDADSQSDIHMVSLEQGVESSRQLTFTDDHDETSPAWAPDGSIVFASDRDGDEVQLSACASTAAKPGG